MKNIYYATTIVIVLLVSFLGITYSFEYDTDEPLSFSLIGPNVLYMDVNTPYVEYGVKVYRDNIDISDSVKIDDSNLDTSKLGEYKVKYYVDGEYINRTVKVIDTEAPVIKLLGGEEVYILLNGNYQDAGYKVSDNYDTDLEKSVVIDGKVDVKKEGTYILKYHVMDNSGNRAEAIRKVIVKKPVIALDNDMGSRIYQSSYNVSIYSNSIMKNRFNTDGVYFYGYVKNGSNSYKIKLKKRDSKLEYLYSMNIIDNHYYDGNMNLDKLDNGTYDIYIVGEKEERLVNKLNIYSRILRSKVGNKLVTFIYNNDLVSISVEDFKYEYDVAIDPGHGGIDSGAQNGIIREKDLNLKISKYEKCRYESMGYGVYLVRYDDTYGEMLGDKSLDNLDRRGFTMGYYGTVSKVVYSNHHNASNDKSDSGFEFLVANQIEGKDLIPELSLYNKYRDLYKINDNKIRIYSRDYNTSKIYDKHHGEVYNYRNYYALIRIPYELYNVKNVIYEPIYMSNSNDFNWYYSAGNWKKVSELKIEEYVKYMGGKYVGPKENECEI